MFTEKYWMRNVFYPFIISLACSSSSNLSDRFYKNISLQIMGKWYVVEVLEHMKDPTKPVSNSYVIDSCPIVKLRPFEHASLRLLWSEESGNVEYTFRIPDISRRKGVWRTMLSQNGKVSFIFTLLSKF